MFGKPLAPGTVAPEFTAYDHQGHAVRLTELRGRYVILVFYPGDDTPGCTLQLQELRDAWQPLQSAGAAVFALNPASESSHRRFAIKHSFPFPLIVDKGARIARAYRSGLWLLVRRTVYVIGPDGTVLFARRGKPSPQELLGLLQISPQHPPAQKK